MATTRGALTDIDIRTLVKGPSADERAAVAQRLCRTVAEVTLTDAERAQANEILRIMAADAAETVRRALAVTLRESPLLPHDVALRLAQDVDSVSIPVLSASPVFSDEDLAEIIRLGGPVRQLAVAGRAELSSPVADAIAEHGAEGAVQRALRNERARFTDAGLGRALDRFASAETVVSAMAYRAVLPLSVSERLVALASDEVRKHLTTHHGVAADTADVLAGDTLERATVDLVDQAGETADLKRFCAHLNTQGRLSASLLLRGLAHGHIAFFEWGVAELSGVPHHRAWLMIHDAGSLGLKAIYERAGLPARMLPSFRAAIDAFHALSAEGAEHDRDRFQERMLQRFLTQPQAAGREDLDYLLDRMDQLSRKAEPVKLRA